MVFKNDKLKIETAFDCSDMLIQQAIDLYKSFNREVFVPPLYQVNSIFSEPNEILCSAFNQSHKFSYHDFGMSKVLATNNKSVLICFSGGLDSVYQALSLREQGYEVHLFHVANMNKYTNGQELKAAEEFAKDFNFPLHTANMSASGKSKFWFENPFKNTLLYTIAYEYMLKLNIGILSCGDDLRLPLAECAKEYNIADTRELTLAFINKLKEKAGIEFLQVDDTVEKAARLEYLRNNNAIDYYYSCVGSGRFNKSLHAKNEAKYGIKLEKYNCGSCRKCCIHSIMDYYVNKRPFSKDYIDHCWEKVAVGSDAIYFGKHLTEEERLANFSKY